MEEKETLKDKIVDFWDYHKYDIVGSIWIAGCAVLGYKTGMYCYNKGYNKGAFDTMACCEKYLPEAKVTSTLTQIAMNQTKK